MPLSFDTGNEGSSPRIRGECYGEPEAAGRQGIIPANTGRINPPMVTSGRMSDHPREYGENTNTAILIGLAMGSSPRIRGESREVAGPLHFDGIIPANTGRIAES